MKLVKKQLGTDGAGPIKMVPEEGEDMWHLYNLVAEGDRVTAVTFRNVQRETGGGTGVESNRMKLTLKINVEKIEYDADVQQLRLRGKVLTESDHVRMGSYHTLEVEPQRAVTVEKDAWDALALDRVKQACDPAASADLAALMMQEGLALLCLVGGACTVVKAKIEQSMPRKRGAAAQGYGKAQEKFFTKCLSAIERHVNFSVVKCFVVAGPGFTKDEFLRWYDLEIVRRDLRALRDHRSQMLVTHASSAFKHSLKEVLVDEGVMRRIKDTKAARDVQALETFFNVLAEDPARAFYGPGHVAAAAELGAIDTLLLSDSLFRNQDVGARQRYVDLVESVESAGGRAHIFSAMHVSGQQLEKLTGVAATLRFPLPELEDAELDNTLG